jgi:energy-coupling factor transporter ATP-binding protein EcfA2
MNTSLQDWFNAQHQWIQEAAYRFLTNGSFEETDIEDFVKIVKSTTDQKKPQKSSSRTYPSFPVGTSGTESVRLKSIEEVSGIDRLSPRKPIEFAPENLVVIYGSNGSGKTGYSRILKRMCGKVGSQELKHNVFAPSPDGQWCKVTFDVNTIPHTRKWLANEPPIIELSSVDIFDSLSSKFYLESETESPVNAAELVLLSAIVDVCQKVKSKLEIERDTLRSALPQLPSQYKGTAPGISFLNLKPETKLEERDKFFSWLDEDMKRQEELLAQRTVKDPSAEAGKRRAVHKQVKQLMTKLNSAMLSVSQEECKKIHDIRQKAKSARSIAKQGAEALGNGSHLKGIESATWKAMWEAARVFSNSDAYPNFSYPYLEEGARCVLCQQDFSAEAKTRLVAFEDFVSGTLESDAVACEKSAQLALSELPQTPAEEEILTSCQAAELEPKMVAEVTSAWSRVRNLVNQLSIESLDKVPEGIQYSEMTVIASLTHHAQAVETTALNYEKLALDDGAQAREVELLELQAKKWTSEQRSAIDAEVDRLSSMAAITEMLKQTSTSKLSIKAGELSEELITAAFIKRFNFELKKLGASRIQVELAQSETKLGKVKHRIRLKNANKFKVSEVLSEGESRIVCLASFLASVMGKPGSSPFIFDDPISSLDQDFEEKVIERLIDLSHDRQVIILTHRLSFISIIDSITKQKKVPIRMIAIRSEDWGTGEPGDMPIFAEKPSKALNRLLNERLAQAEREYKTNGTEAYYPLAKAICSDTRILIERIVELTLLADVIQRHRREVNTKGKVKNLLKITHEDCALIDKFMTEYSKYEHSQSYEAPVDLPTPEELENDLKNLIEWHEEFSKRPLP